MIQRRELASKPVPDNKTQEEKENQEMSLFNALPEPRGCSISSRKIPPPHC